MAFLLLGNMSAPLMAVLILLLAYIPTALTQDCSATKLCATGCCSQFGFCGTDSDHCGAGCLSTCDFKLGCDASNPCSGSAAGTCCSKYGFCGLGPDFCAPDVCVAGCTSKSYCDPGYSAPGFAQVENCPLNVCCSKYGFCGLTEEFCGNKTVQRPSCGNAGTIDRVIGYYEGWATSRACDVFVPEDIPKDIYTHINFAFASINPTTFEVVPASNDDIGLYKRLTSLKDHQPGLKVFIAIGGWTFNDPGPTATTFSDIAGSDANMNAFFKSLTSFMSTYNFDGVDIDWEYPAADDRSGRPQDFANYPYFISQLKKALQGTDGRDGLSITIPASYWYLQHFDIANLVKSVDFFNMMTYDLHGAWDIGNKWLGAYLNAHTNLTEITDSLDLLWRNGISPDKVNLGLAFYARTSTLNPGGCADPGCEYASAGLAGPCSKSVGTLTNAELEPIIAAGTPKLYTDAAVKYITWDTNQWAAYDDEDTWNLKVKFAKSECLGGVFVWAISQDNPNDLSSNKALAAATGRVITAAEEDTTANGSPTIQESYNQDQCKWSNCDEGCPSDFSTVLRGDKDVNYAGEIMQDDNYCDGAGKRVFCCPNALPQPRCGWYNFKGGACNDPTCPEGYTEVGSTQQGCRGSWSYQAACCEVEDNTPQQNVRVATDLYSQCSWAGAAKNCDASCPSGKTNLVSSWAGSGAVKCDLQHGITSDQADYYQYRQYCCDQPFSSELFENCNWYDDLGFYAKNKNPGTYCTSGCPKGKTRVAMSNRVAVPSDPIAGKNCLKGGGAAAYCCNAVNNATRTVINPALALFQSDLLAWAESPTCPSKAVALAKRSWEESSVNASAMSHESLLGQVHIGRRDDTASLQNVLTGFAVVLGAVLSGQWNAYTAAEGQQWDGGIQLYYPGLTVSSLNVFKNAWELPNLASYSITDLARVVLCNPEDYNAQSLAANGRDAGAALVSCDFDFCDYMDCEDPSNEDRYSDSMVDDDVVPSAPMRRRKEGEALDKRGPPRPWSVPAVLLTTPNGGRAPFQWQSMQYNSAGAYPSNDPIYNDVVDWQEPGDCGNSGVRLTTYAAARQRGVGPRGLALEHITELSTPQDFLRDRSVGLLGSQVPAIQGYTPLRSSFSSWPVDFYDYLQNYAIDSSLLTPLPGGANPNIPIERIMELLGSKTNVEFFMILLQPINSVKSRNWQHKAIFTPTSMNTFLKKADPKLALSATRGLLGSWNYLTLSTTRKRHVAGLNALREEWGNIGAIYNAVYKGQRPPVDTLGAWDEWIAWKFKKMADDSNTFLDDQLPAITSAYANPATPSQTAISRLVYEAVQRQSGDRGVVNAANLLADLDGVD